MNLQESMHKLRHAVQDAGSLVRSPKAPARPQTRVISPEMRELLSTDVPRGAVGPLIDAQGFDDGGITSSAFTHDGIPLLDSFFFQYRSSDHHLQTIDISPDSPNGSMQLIFADDNGDDDYFFHIVHRVVNDPRVLRFKRGVDVFRGSDTVTLDRPSGDFVFVLLGFEFFYRDGDHHLREISLLEDNGQLTVSFADENFDDGVGWSVEFAYVPADLFTALGQSSGIRAHGAVETRIQPGPSVLRGFRMEFKPYFTSGNDHHVRVTLDDGRIQVFYEDENSDDGFDWTVRWGILNSA